MTSSELSISYLHLLNNKSHAGYRNDFTQLPRPFTSIAYMREGTVDFFIDDRVERVGKGDIIFIPFGATYHSYSLTDANYISIYLTLERFAGRSLRYRIERVSGEGLLEDFECLRDALAIPANPPRNTDALDFKLLERLYRILDRVDDQLHPTKLKALDPRIAKALDLIERSFKLPLNVGELARLCHLSVSHFHTLFLAQVGLTPIEYKNRVAVTFAERLLCENRLSIEEIGEAAGFSSSVYFRRVFKSFTGLTPREYRKNGIL